MKDFNWKLIITLLFLLLTGSVFASGNVKWHNDGTVTDQNNHKIKLALQNVYSGLQTKSGLFVIGYKIDANKINYPVTAWASSDLKNTQYWNFENDLQDVFLYQDRVRLLDSTGAVYQWENSDWSMSDIKLEPSSRIIDSNQDIIGCYPSSLFKDSTKAGACYSVGLQWKVSANWWEITPKVCGTYLFIFEKVKNKNRIRKINISDGSELEVLFVDKAPKDLCLVTS